MTAGEAEAARIKLKHIDAVVAMASGVLAGNPPDIQGAALVQLTALWLAGFLVPDDPAGQEMTRERLLQLHVESVRQFIPVMYAERIAPKLAAREKGE